MYKTRKPIELRNVADRALEMAEDMSKWVTKAIHAARMSVERPAQPKPAPAAKPTTRAKGRKRTASRKAA